MVDDELDSTNSIDQKLSNLVERWGIITQTVLDSESVDTALQKDELVERSKKILEEDEVPEEDEERLSYLVSVMRAILLDTPQEADPREIGAEFLRHPLVSALEDYDDRYLSSLEPMLELLLTFDEHRKKEAQDYLFDFYHTESAKAVTQAHTYLIEELLEGERNLKITDAQSVQFGRTVYSKCMDICDSGMPRVVAIKRISDNCDPREKDLQSMGFTNALKELQGTPFEPLAEGIDLDLRHAISHGDVLVNPKEETITIAGEGSSYSFNQFEEIVNQAIFTSELVSMFDGLVFVLFHHQDFQNEE
jgi:hypothetical protein